MIILYDNKVQDATISATVENPDYPFSAGLKDTRLSRIGRTIDTEDQAILFEFKADITSEYAVILKHNFTSSATVKLQANTSDDWTTPPLEEDFTAYGDSLVCKITGEYAFWRIFIDDPTSTATGLEIGYVFLGEALKMPGFNRGVIMPNKSNSISQKSTSGQLYGDRRLNYKSADVVFSGVTETERQEIKAFWNTVDVVQPFILMIWEDDLDVEEPIYCSLAKELEWNKLDIFGLLWSLNLSFEEVF